MTSSTPANEYVADTMAIVIRLERRRLGERARRVFERVEAGEALLHVPGIVFAEILYLSERKKISTSVEEVADYMVRNPTGKEFPLSLAVIQAAARITDIPELHDRLIAATGHLLGLEIVTVDTEIEHPEFVRTLW